MNSINLFRNADHIEAFIAGTAIFQMGDDGHFMYAVIDGSVDIMIGSCILETVESGGIFGEMALVDAQPRSTTVIAKTDCTIALIDEKQFAYMIQQTPFFALNVMRIMCERLRHTDGLLLVQNQV